MPYHHTDAEPPFNLDSLRPSSVTQGEALAAAAAAIPSSPPPQSPPPAPVPAPAPPPHIDTFARLQLAAALLEYDHDLDGKLAEQSAIFTPYRDAAAGAGGTGIGSGSTGYLICQDQEEQPYPTTAGGGDGATVAPSLSIGLIPPTSLLSGNVVRLENGQERDGPAPGESAGHDDNDNDLASEWGLDSVMTKFDAKNFDPSVLTSGTKLPANKRKKRRQRRRSLAHSEFDDYAFGGGGGPYDTRSQGDPVTTSSFELNHRRSESGGLQNTRSLPDVLDHTQLRGFDERPRGTKAPRKTRISLDLESELDQAFGGSFDGDAEDGARSRSSAYGGGLAPTVRTGKISFDVEELAGPSTTSASYAQEIAARPSSSLGLLNTDTTDETSPSSSYVSRFDPKALARARAEEEATRIRFPNSLHPKILVMPAPLADLVVEEQRQKEEAEQIAQQEAEEQAKPRVEREAGKLYGKSLMDELNERKKRQKSKQMVFTGDNRRAMMENPVSLAHRQEQLRRKSSPLRGESSALNGDTEDSEEDDIRPLMPKPVEPVKIAIDDADPWAKYASHRSLDALAAARDSTTPDPQRMSSLLPSPGIDDPSQQSPNRASTAALLSPPDAVRLTSSMSTRELQDHYRRQSTMTLQALTAGKGSERQEEDSEEDDDIPLDTRRAQLAQSPTAKPASATQPSKDAQGIPTSVFGQDLIMARELEKLEKILRIEEAEKRIEAEKARVKQAELDAKEAKKRAKAEKKAKKREEKEKEKTRSKSVSSFAPFGEQQLPSPASCDGPQLGRLASSHPDTQSRRTDTAMLSHRSMAQGSTYDFRGLEEANGDEADEEDLWNARSGVGVAMPDAASGTRPRSSSIAPSLALNLLTTNLSLPAARPEGDMSQWFADDTRSSSSSLRSASDSDGDDAASTVRSRRAQRKRAKSIDIYADVASSGIDSPAGVPSPAIQEGMANAKRPELTTIDQVSSFAGLLDTFGPAQSDSDTASAAGSPRRPKSSRKVVMDEGAGSESEEEESEPLSHVVARRSALLLSSRAPLEAPKLDLALNLGSGVSSPIKGSLGQEDLATGKMSRKEKKGKKKKLGTPDDDASDDESGTSDSEDDDLPLAVQKLNADLAAKQQLKRADEDSEEDDDLPLALQQEDDLPLGQMNPQAIVSQQLAQQHEQNIAMMAQLQLQYSQYQHMQMQHAASQQTLVPPGYPGQQPMLAVWPDPNMPQTLAASTYAGSHLSGAASDIGLDVPRDPGLVSSVDRWRSNVEI